MSKLFFDFNLLVKETIGDNGISESEIATALDDNKSAISRFLNDVSKGRIGFTSILDNEEILSEINNFASTAKNRFKSVVILGIGGSSLGPMMVLNALKPFSNYHNAKKRYFFVDTVDPVSISGLMTILNLEETLFIAISKSGNTIETQAALLYFVNEAIKKKLCLKDHFVIVTDPQNGPFREFAVKYNLKSFPIKEEVGGRYSLLTPVGLLPCALFDVDINRLIMGARDFVKIFLAENLWKNPVLLTAISIYILNTRGYKNFVIFPYGNSLSLFSDWSIQLWAESLGKRYNLDNQEIFFGHTPIKAVGPKDQHSQLQLFMEGPKDKIFLFISINKPKTDLIIVNQINDIDSMKELDGLSFNRLLLSEKRAVSLALAKEGRPSFSIELETLDEFAIGKLVLYLELTCALMGYILHINPFDQPGVELGKIYTKALLEIPKFKDRNSEIMSIEMNKKMLIIEI